MTITRSHDFDSDGSRYFYDCNLPRHYAQLTTSEDASYYGNWASATDLTLIAFAEGDITVTRCDSQQEFKQEVLAFKAFTDRAGIRFYGIDPGVLHTEETLAPWQAAGLADLIH